MGLLDVYEQMIAGNTTTQTEPVAEVAPAVEQEKVAATEVVDERMQVLEKYAELADDLLEKEYGKEYTEDDVVKLAQLMINHDIEVQEQLEKVAELHEAGVIMAKAFKAELEKK